MLYCPHMETLNNAKIILNTVFSLFLLTILAVAFLFTPFEKASAYTVYGQLVGGNIVYGGGTMPPEPVYSYYNVNVPVYVPTPTPMPTPAPTPTLYSNSTNPKAVAAAPKAKAIAKAKVVEPVKEEEMTDKYSDLAASAIFGESGFLPSGLVQWVLLAILVLGGTILVRKVYGGSEKYYAAPMKHN